MNKEKYKKHVIEVNDNIENLLKDNEEAIIIFNSLVGEKTDCQTVKSLLKENEELKKKEVVNMSEERLNELFSIVNEGHSSIQEREIRDYITNLQQENKQLKEDIKNIIKILDKNCDDLEATEEEFDSLDRWQGLQVVELEQGSDSNE